MGKEREIKVRMKAVANIRRITNTMQMIATARFQSALRRATSAKPYTQMIAGLVGELSAAATSGGGGNSGGGGGEGSLDHPLLHAPPAAVGKQLMLVVTSNRGLCGAYNGNVLRRATRALKESEGGVRLEVAGKKGLAYFRYTGREVSQFHSQLGDQPSFRDAQALADRYIAEFSAGTYDRVSVVYMAFESVARQKPDVLTLLPLEPPRKQEQGKAKRAPGVQPIYEFSPDPKLLLNELLPATVRTQLFQCFNEATVGEQVARMVAMKAATDAAGKMGKRLTRQYNRARQTAITTELTEIIGGAAALA